MSDIEEAIDAGLFGGLVSLPQIEKVIAKLEAEIKDIRADIEGYDADEERYKRLLDLGVRDYLPDNYHKKFIKHLRYRVKTIEQKIEDLNAETRAIRASIAAGVDLQANREFKETPYDTASETGGDMVPFTDCRTAFLRSLVDWALKVQIEIESLSDELNKQDVNTKHSALILAGTLTKVFKQAAPVVKVIGIAADVHDEITKVAKVPKGSVDGLKKSIIQILNKATSTETALEKRFNNFVIHWKRENGVPNEQDKIPKSIFQKECDYFSQRYMPKPAAIKRAFVAEVISFLRDDESYDWDQDGSSAGYVYVKGRLRSWDNTKADFKINLVELNDTPTAMTKAVKEYFSGLSIIDLPLEIRIGLSAPVAASGGGVTYDFFTFTRRDRTPGNTKFFQTSGPMTAPVREAFKKHKLFIGPMVSDI